MRPIKRVIVHHSAGPDGGHLDIEAIRAFHISPPPAGRGWQDIGYHFVIEHLAGTYLALPGRPVEMAGSHAQGHNADSIGVCLVGNFLAVEPPPQQVAVAAQLINQLCLQYRLILGRDVLPHRAVRETLCPGLAWQAIARRLGITTTF